MVALPPTKANVPSTLAPEPILAVSPVIMSIVSVTGCKALPVTTKGTLE